MVALTPRLSLGYFDHHRARFILAVVTVRPAFPFTGLMVEKFIAQFKGLFYGWWMVAVGCGIRMLGGGFHLYGFTVFFLPITQELGLSRAATSLVFSLARAEGAIEGPLAGYLIDRLGPRPMMLAGVILSGIGYMRLATIESYSGFVIVYLGVISLSFSAGFMHSPMVLANTWFIRRRALAMTLVSSAIGIGGTLITPLLAISVHMWGWRWGAFLSGVGLILVGVPIAMFVRRSPESIGTVPDGAAADENAGREEAAGGGANQLSGRQTDVDFTLKQAMRTSTFWMIILATTTRVAVYNAITVHFIPIMVWRGISEQRAALLLATMALMSLPSHLLVGWIADHVSKPRLMGICMSVGAASIFFLAYGAGEWALWAFTLLFTFMEAIFPVGWATVGDFFGRKSFATIRGTMSFFYLWGPALGPVITGAVYDRYHSYSPLMSAFIALSLISSLLYATLKKPQAPSK
jgi:sugar phosphate permease